LTFQGYAVDRNPDGELAWDMWYVRGFPYTDILVWAAGLAGFSGDTEPYVGRIDVSWL